MNKSSVMFICISVTLVSGCGVGGQWINGNPFPDKTLKPYVAHWIKAGMTREGRRLDLAKCGALNGAEDIVFDSAEIEKNRRPEESNSIAAYLRLRDRVGACMRVEGYAPVGDLKFLGGCDERCMYP